MSNIKKELFITSIKPSSNLNELINIRNKHMKEYDIAEKQCESELTKLAFQAKKEILKRLFNKCVFYKEIGFYGVIKWITLSLDERDLSSDENIFTVKDLRLVGFYNNQNDYMFNYSTEIKMPIHYLIDGESEFIDESVFQHMKQLYIDKHLKNAEKNFDSFSDNELLAKKYYPHDSLKQEEMLEVLNHLDNDDFNDVVLGYTCFDE